MAKQGWRSRFSSPHGIALLPYNWHFAILLNHEILKVNAPIVPSINVLVRPSTRTTFRREICSSKCGR